MTDATLRYEAAAERRGRVLSALRLAGFVSIADLAGELRVSQMTIRRDLHALEDRGHVRVVHGGASLAPGALRGSAFPDAHARSQERVARRAAGLVGASDTIAIDAGDGLRPRPRPAGGLRRLRDHALDARAAVARRADGRSPDGLAGGRTPRRPRRVRRPDDGGRGGAVARAHLLLLAV